MFGRKRHRLAKPQIEAFERARRAGAPLGLVGDEDQWLIRAANEIGEEAIGRRQTGARVEHEEYRIGEVERRCGLRAHPAGQGGAVALLQSGGVDDLEGEIAQSGLALASVAGHPWAVVHERELFPGEPVEQRRFANVRPANDRDGKHSSGLLLCRRVSGRRGSSLPIRRR